VPRQRKSGDGQFLRTPSGRVRYRVQRGYHPDGRRRLLNFYGDTEGECRRQWLEHQLEERLLGQATPADKRKTTLGAFAPVFLDALAGEIATGTIQPRTAAFYADTLRLHVLPALGGARLRDIGAEQLERLYARHADHPRTAVAVHQTCQRLLKMAKRYRYTVTLATEEAAKPRYKAPERQPPGGAELKRVLDAAEATGPLMAAVLALACTGLRPGEVMGLDVPALNLAEGYADVLIARETRSAPVEKPVKSEKARRRLPLTRRTVALLRVYLEREPVRRLSGPVFCTRSGAPLRWYNVSRGWPPIRDAAGLPTSTRPYDLRHAFVSELLAEGVPLHEVSWLAGHASVHFTADQYGHRVKRRDQAVRSALERSMGEE
jgi:integrase